MGYFEFNSRLGESKKDSDLRRSQAVLEEARQAQIEKVVAAVAEGKIVLGMTAEDARRSWGSPTKINASIGGYGKHEQWVYERGRYRTQYVYVENGVVTSMQTPE